MAVLAITGFGFVIAGIIGCALPFVPGPLLSYLGLILLSVARRWEVFSITFLVVMGIIILIVTGLNYVVPMYTKKKYGASRLGLWGGIIGLGAGIMFIPPFGLLIGAFLGAMLGELIVSKDQRSSWKAGYAVFIGTVLGIVYRLSVSGIIASYFLRAFFTH